MFPFDHREKHVQDHHLRTYNTLVTIRQCKLLQITSKQITSKKITSWRKQVMYMHTLASARLGWPFVVWSGAICSSSTCLCCQTLVLPTLIGRIGPTTRKRLLEVGLPRGHIWDKKGCERRQAAHTSRTFKDKTELQVPRENNDQGKK